MRIDLGNEPLALRGREPGSLLRMIGDDKEDGDSKKDRGQTFAEEEPLPPGNMSDAIEAQQKSGKRSADDSRDRAAVMKSAKARARCAIGNQRVRQRMMPGKNPASAAPRRKRAK